MTINSIIYEQLKQPEVGERIRRLRQDFGLTQQQFGDLAGVTKQTIVKWEHSQCEPRQSSLSYVIDALCLSERYFMKRVFADSHGKELTFHSVLKYLRENARMTLKQVSRSTGIPVTTIASLEDDNSNLDITEFQLKSFCSLFNIEREDLLGTALTAEEKVRKIREEKIARINKALDSLNSDGLIEATKRVEALMELPGYQR